MSTVEFPRIFEHTTLTSLKSLAYPMQRDSVPELQLVMSQIRCGILAEFNAYESASLKLEEAQAMNAAQSQSLQGAMNELAQIRAHNAEQTSLRKRVQKMQEPHRADVDGTALIVKLDLTQDEEQEKIDELSKSIENLKAEIAELEDRLKERSENFTESSMAISEYLNSLIQELAN